MNIRLSDHFSYGRLLRFTAPSVAMMVFTSVYGIVDGYFVSNYTGKTPFAAVNLIFPFLMILGSLGFMLGAGGSAIVSKTFGEQNPQKANEIFSLIVYITIAAGTIIALLGILFLPTVASWLGADGALLDGCVLYGRIFLVGLPAFMLQMEFQSFFITAEKPKLGLVFTVASGVTNMVLDWLLVGVLHLGLAGAASATVFSQMIGGVAPLFYFRRKNSGLLRLGKTHFDGRALLKACTNGSSELMSNISMSLVNILYNARLMRYVGEDGVAAYGVLMYVCFIFVSVFIGYSIGTAPVVGYHYGAQDKEELHSLMKKSLVIIGVASVAMVAASLLLAAPFSRLYVGYDEKLFDLTVRAFRFNSFTFLFSGFAIYSSGFFTALSDGLTSALISFLRSLVFQSAAVLVMPLLFDIDGIWMSLVVSEALSVGLSVFFLLKKRKKYGY